MTAARPDTKAVKQAIQWMLRLREWARPGVSTTVCAMAQCHHEHEHAWQRVTHLHQNLDLRAIPVPGWRQTLKPASSACVEGGVEAAWGRCHGGIGELAG
jgi:ferric-dicitrate binding protein FerR (iron transport regulator)